jgi:hypothetical protein
MGGEQGTYTAFKSYSLRITGHSQNQAACLPEVGIVGSGITGEAEATLLPEVGIVGSGITGEVETTPLAEGGIVGRGITGLAKTQVELVARIAARRVFRTFSRLEFIPVLLLGDNLDTRE